MLMNILRYGVAGLGHQSSTSMCSQLWCLIPCWLLTRLLGTWAGQHLDVPGPDVAEVLVYHTTVSSTHPMRIHYPFFWQWWWLHLTFVFRNVKCHCTCECADVCWCLMVKTVVISFRLPSAFPRMLHWAGAHCSGISWPMQMNCSGIQMVLCSGLDCGLLWPCLEDWLKS